VLLLLLPRQLGADLSRLVLPNCTLTITQAPASPRDLGPTRRLGIYHGDGEKKMAGLLMKRMLQTARRLTPTPADG
jgi:hypothetical protein